MASDIFTLLRVAPGLIKTAAQVQKAVNGDPAALEYVKQQGWKDAIELVRPGTAANIDEAIHHGKQAFSALSMAVDGNIIEGEFTELDDTPPWLGFSERLQRARCGGHIILGPIGAGKTTIAKRLAEKYYLNHGYKVEAVNMYPEDVPEFASIIGIDTLVKRMRQLGKYLKSQTVLDPDELEAFGNDDDEDDGIPCSLPPQRRVIIIDEAILAMSSNPNDPARRAALQALAQCRHLDWVVIYIGQWAGQLPLALLGMCTVWVKQPGGREDETDRDHPIVKGLWRRTTEAFATIKHSSQYRYYPDPRAWAYCDCQSLNGQPGYSGLIPFNMPGSGDE
jgi:hypothetical protein